MVAQKFFVGDRSHSSWVLAMDPADRDAVLFRYHPVVRSLALLPDDPFDLGFVQFFHYPYSLSAYMALRLGAPPPVDTHTMISSK